MERIILKSITKMMSNHARNLKKMCHLKRKRDTYEISSCLQVQEGFMPLNNHPWNYLSSHQRLMLIRLKANYGIITFHSIAKYYFSYSSQSTITAACALPACFSYFISFSLFLHFNQFFCCYYCCCCCLLVTMKLWLWHKCEWKI